MRNNGMPAAYMLLNTKPDSEMETISRTKEILDSRMAARYEVQGVYGVYDIVVRVECDEMDDLRDILARVRRIGKVVSTMTMLVS